MARKRSAGRPPRDDTEIKAAVRRIRAAQPRLSYNAAALRYAKEHPEPGVSPEATARRIASKLQAEDGRPQKRRVTRRARAAILLEVGILLARVNELLQELASLEQEGSDE